LIDYENVKDRYFDKDENLKEGIEVDMNNDVMAMFVWIPRYKYAVPEGESEREISIIFEPGYATTGLNSTDAVANSSKIDELTEEDYYTHPAFRFNNKDLPGIWVAKFESGTLEENRIANEMKNTMYIKPNIASYTNHNVSSMWELVRTNINNDNVIPNMYGLINDVDVHPMKNMEWGSVAILSQSKYGKYGNDEYSIQEKEIFLNNSSIENGYAASITGCSSGKKDSQVIQGCKYTYDEVYYGTGASTTGTIYGVYDMSGGAYEVMMGNFLNYSGNSEDHQSGFIGPYGHGGENRNGIVFPPLEYYDYYKKGMTSYKGDATKMDAMSGWYSDYDLLVDENFPWYIRGVCNVLGKYSGIFSCFSGCGSEVDGVTIRLSLINV